MLSCPICQTPLVLNCTQTPKTYQCASKHSYDVAKEGYVNLHVVQHKNSKRAGDTPESVQARRRFLAQGFYEPLRTKIGEILSDSALFFKPFSVLDIGCGEGYYTARLAECAKMVFGLDIAKSAVQASAKAHKNTANITWVVGTGAVLPMMDGSIDVCTSFFSPLPKREMCRVLKANGYLLLATPAPNHLFSLRKRLFEQVVPHSPDKFLDELAPEFRLVHSWQIDSELSLDGQSLSDLIDMTPYTYKARLENKTALKSLAEFKTSASFMLYLLQKS
ncbi:methyltransferase [Moraxella caviae]|uniref:Methyltransferase n=1 Tax=Moraxella caviae TaxID=34060 RepID=A0A1T0A9P8_9GAMM|nr:methyltransferase domain-containing protein [Moraxella caviae]OOR92454.1 methyltransferase [Moraxella caviae]STZ13841.1 Ribosomal RNA large subunit methyltransferase A [Moraxella caviae]VEW12898.1 Ribosomal RNA large subunit methyltransferase A [Moraxella caviae]VEW13143.1 Ribosomal RNA large subunit methyltransferase A [Moraxella caviae]